MYMHTKSYVWYWPILSKNSKLNICQEELTAFLRSVLKASTGAIFGMESSAWYFLRTIEVKSTSSFRKAAFFCKVLKDVLCDAKYWSEYMTCNSGSNSSKVSSVMTWEAHCVMFLSKSTQYIKIYGNKISWQSRGLAFHWPTIYN